MSDMPQDSAAIQESFFHLAPHQERALAVAGVPAGDAAARTVRLVFRCDPGLAPALLQERWNRIVRRHEVLRTQYQLQAGRAVPFQCVAEMPIPAFEARIAGVDEAGTSIELDLPWLSLDVRSVHLLAAELLDGSVRDDAPLGFADVSEWLRGLAETAEADEARRYWQQVPLDGAGAACLPWLKDEGGPAAHSVDMAERVLGHERTAAIRNLCLQLGVEEADFHLALLALACAHLGDRTQLVIGLEHAGRSDGELLPVVGMLARVVPLALQVDLRLAGADWIRQVAAERARSSAWAEYFDEGLLPESRRAVALPLQFAFDDLSDPAIEAVAAAVTHCDWAAEPARLRLRTQAFGQDSRLRLQWPGAALTSLEAEHLLDVLVAAIDRLVAAVDRPLDTLGAAIAQSGALAVQPAMAPEASAEAILLAGQLDHWARHAPDSPAIRDARDVWTYGTLSRNTRKAASVLRAWGVRRGDRVALIGPRSLWQLAACHAIWAAGAAFVVIDPDLPESRRELLLQDSRASLVIAPHAPGTIAGVRCEDLERLFQTDAPADEALPLCHPLDTAYLVYTSGTTGRSKAVMVPHGAVAAYVAGIGLVLDPVRAGGGRLGMGCLSSMSVDLGYTTYFGALAHGDCAEIVDDHLTRDPAALAAHLGTRRFDVLKIVPSLLRALLAELDPQACRELLPQRALLLGGERSDAEMVRRLAELAPTLRVINHYGPSETTVGVLTSVLSPGRPIIVGSALRGTRVDVLDDDLRPVPSGFSGQLFVSGAQLATGYLDRPSQTAAAFRPAVGGGRRYATGDRVRRHPNGDIEFIGRLDDQAKIRGHRVEPAEVETALRCLAGVTAAACSVVDRDGRSQLVAHVVTAATHADVASLRVQLQACLPEHMIPTLWCRIDAMPLLENGKIDRKALPPAGVDGRSAGVHVAARNAAEQVLCDIMRSLLRIEQLSIHDNFFELGGDSIIAIQIAARARRAGLRFNADQLFAHPTVAELAAVATVVGVVTAEQGIVTGRAPLAPIQARYFEHHGGQGVYNHGRAFVPTCTFDERALRRVLARLCNHHDVLRSRFEHVDGRWEQVVGPAVTESDVSLTIEDVPAALHGTDLERWIEDAFDAGQRRVDALASPVLHAVWLKDPSPDRTRLLIAVHHLVADVVSWNILLEDLVACDPRTPEPPVLPDKSSAFLAWSRALNAHADTAEVQGELDFWLRMAQAAVELPLDHASGLEANIHAAVEMVRFSLDGAQTARLLASQPAAHRDAVTDLLLAALASALQGWTGRDQVVVEMESHGREPLFEEVDHVRTVGWFTSRYPVAIDLSGATDAAARLARVAAIHAEVPGRGLGYGLLRYLATDPAARALRGLPSPQVSLNYVGQMHSQAGTSDAWLVPAGSAGHERGPSVQREHLLTWIAGVFDGCLHVRCQYGGHLHERATIVRLADAMRAGLLEVLECGVAGGRVDDALAGFDGAADRQHWLGRHAEASADRVRSIYPLSPLQHGMLFHSIAAPGSGAYLLQMVAELGHGVDVVSLRQAWQDVIDVHPVLRTGFAGLGSETPLQFVLADVQVPWAEHDWSGLDEAGFGHQLSAFLSSDRGTDFRIEHAPLMRVTLIRRPDRGMTMVWTRHHAIVDGWSSSMLMGDLVAAYARRSVGAAAIRTPRPGFRGYIGWLGEQAAGEREAEFWQAYLRGCSLPTPLTIGGERAPDADFSIDLHAALDGEVSERLRTLARSARTTFNVLAQAAWGKVLAAASGVDDVAFGAVVSGRPAELPDVEQMIGPFINTQVVRVPTALDWQALLAHMHAGQIGRERFAHTPPTTVRRMAGLGGDNEMFQSLFLFQNYAVDDEGYASPDNPLPVIAVRSHDKTNYPFTLYVTPKGDVRLRLSCDPARVSRPRAEAMLASYVAVLTAIAEEGGWPAKPPVMAIESMRITSEDAEARDHWLVAGTFNVEPLTPVLEHFGRLFRHGVRCELAPHGQVVEVLLDSEHRQRSGHAQPVLVCLRWQDWMGEGDEQRQRTQVVGAAAAFRAALADFRAHAGASVWIVIAPPSPHLQGQWSALFEDLDAALAQTVAGLPGVDCMALAALQDSWQLQDVHDPHSDQIAHLPYTPQAYAAIAADAFRRHDAVSRAPFKVLVLDCDNTLWGGVCGEVGTEGVQIDGPYDAVRALARAAKAGGMLLAIASRNNEADVRNVFERRALGLQMSDFACWRIDWRAKSEGIAEMAQELDLGLDSFVFLDDDPVQVLEVSSALPGVVALCLPESTDEIARFLQHLWPLDPSHASDGRDRTQLYEQGRRRALARSEAGSLAEFIEGLAVESTFAPIDATHVVRLADLAQRTNQFNLTLRRHTEAELGGRLARGQLEGTVVHVRDRFGDYGLVGAVLYTEEAGCLRVSDWWLSCRALGRHVEYSMLHWLATHALDRGLDDVVLEYEHGPRNVPALEFLRSVQAQAEHSVMDERALRASAQRLQAVVVLGAQPVAASPRTADGALGRARPEHAYREVATRLRDASSIVRAVSAASGAGIRRADYVAPRGESERLLARLMGELLEITDVGADDNFFAMGGHSLMAVRLVARIAEVTGAQIALHTVLESPKVADLALRLDLLGISFDAVDDDTYELLEI